MNSRLDQAVAKTDILRKMYIDAGDFAMLPLIDQMQEPKCIFRRIYLYGSFLIMPCETSFIRERFKSWNNERLKMTGFRIAESKLTVRFNL